MAGLILGALAGAAGGFERAYDDNLKEERAIAGEQRRAGIEDQRARAMLLFRQGMEDKARTDMAARISGAAGAIADEKVGKTRGLIEGNIADRETWTPEQQAAVDQSLALDRKAVADDPDVRTAAAVQTGDIDPRTAAGLDIQGKKAEAAARAGERKEALEREKLDRRDANEKAEREQRDRIADQRHGATLAAISARGGRDKGDDSKISREERLRYTTLFNEAGRRISENQRRLTTLQKDPMYSTAPAGSPERQELDDIRQSIRDANDERKTYGSLLAQGAEGSDSKDGAKAAQEQPAAAPKNDGAPPRITSQAEHAKLPKGTRYVAPDGKTYIKN